MEIKNINSPQFQGSFLINYKKALPEVKEGLEKVIGKNHKQVFRDFKGDKDKVLYVLRDTKDAKVANYIVKNEINFRYYPEVDTKCRFDEQKPELVIEYFKKFAPKMYKNPEEMILYLEGKGKPVGNNSEKYKSKPITNILHTLKLSKKEGQKNVSDKGVTTFIDNETGITLVISPPTKFGTRFVHETPNKDYESVKRYAFDEKGNILKTFEGPSGIKTFSEQFKKAIDEFKK